MVLNRDEAQNKIKEGRFQFAIKCLHEVRKIYQKRNFCFSPRCIYDGLLITYLSVSGSMEQRLRNILRLPEISKFDLMEYCNLKITREDNAAVSYDCRYIIRCWINEYIDLYTYLLLDILNIKLKQIDMSRTQVETINRINQMLRRAMKNYMHDPVKLAVVRKNMELILMTAVCCSNVQKFQICTASQSDASSVSIIPDKRKHKRSFFFQELSIHASEFSYKNSNLSLFVFLPASLVSDKWTIKKDTTHTDICNLIERLSSEEGICELRNLLDGEMTSEDDVGLSTWPIFEVEKNLKIRQLLQALDAEQLLMPDGINLENALDNMYLKVHLGNVVHRARVKVTEDDIIAGAMTLIYTGLESSPSTRYVDVNYNFLFVWLIYDKLYREILFVGVFDK